MRGGAGTGSPTLRRWLLVALLVVALVQAQAAAVASPGGQDQQKLAQRARTLIARLQQQYDAMERVSEQINEINARQASLKRQLRDLEKRRKGVEEQLATAQRLLDEEVRNAYILGPGSLVSDLVTAPDLPEALNRLPLQRSVLEARVAALEQVRRDKAHLDSLKAEVEDALAAQADAMKTVADRRTHLLGLAGQLRTTLGGVDPELAGALAAAELLDENSRRASWKAFWTGSGGRGALGGAWYSPAPEAREAVAYALGHLGAPYVWGAAGPRAFDCSGLTSAAYAAAGIGIPRVSRDQWGIGRHLDLASLIPGDLVFFADNTADPSTIHHVGMYVGRGLMVHAPHTGDVVRVSSIWRTGYIGAVRVVPAIPIPGLNPPPIPPPPLLPPPAPTMTTVRPTTTTSAPATTRPGVTTTTRPGATTTTAPKPPPTTVGTTTTTTEPPTTTDAPPTTAAAATTEAPATTAAATTTTAG
jgi:peptidoglycan DL-endopeptidase CwlO